MDETHRREVERKERIKKLKAKTSKMRLAMKGEHKWNSLSNEQKKNHYSSYSGVKPEHVDLTGTGYKDLPKYVKKGLD
jgi:hypothetical protein